MSLRRDVKKLKSNPNVLILTVWDVNALRWIVSKSFKLSKLLTFNYLDKIVMRCTCLFAVWKVKLICPSSFKFLSSLSFFLSVCQSISLSSSKNVSVNVSHPFLTSKVLTLLAIGTVPYTFPVIQKMHNFCNLCV